MDTKPTKRILLDIRLVVSEGEWPNRYRLHFADDFHPSVHDSVGYTPGEALDLALFSAGYMERPQWKP